MFNGKVRELDMTSGSLVKKTLVFALPLMLSSLLQLLYNAADTVVVGRYAGSDALAAVGSSASLIGLIVTLFIGLSAGVNVQVAKYYGAHNRRGVFNTVHTAMTLGLIFGLLVGVVGFFISRPLLILMDSPENVLDLSTLYLRIYFLGTPGLVIYNFGAAILRAAGDTKRPLFILMISGVLNVVLNLFFVLVCKMTVDGVSLATTISQYVSTVLILYFLIRTDSILQFHPRGMRIHGKSFLNIMKIGLPAGIQGTLFAISNVLIQSSINSFGSIIMAGASASTSIEGFQNVCLESITQSSITATSQNIGAGKFQNIRRVLLVCLSFILIFSALWVAAYYFFGDQLLSIYAPGQPDVIAAGKVRMELLGYTFFLCGMMNVFTGVLRAMGYSILPTFVSLLGICGFRIVWLYAVFPINPTLITLYLSYPVSWIITLAVTFVVYIISRRRFFKRMGVGAAVRTELQNGSEHS